MEELSSPIEALDGAVAQTCTADRAHAPPHIVRTHGALVAPHRRSPLDVSTTAPRSPTAEEAREGHSPGAAGRGSRPLEATAAGTRPRAPPRPRLAGGCARRPALGDRHHRGRSAGRVRDQGRRVLLASPTGSHRLARRQGSSTSPRNHGWRRCASPRCGWRPAGCARGSPRGAPLRTADEPCTPSSIGAIVDWPAAGRPFPQVITASTPADVRLTTLSVAVHELRNLITTARPAGSAT